MPCACAKCESTLVARWLPVQVAMPGKGYDNGPKAARLPFSQSQTTQVHRAWQLASLGLGIQDRSCIPKCGTAGCTVPAADP